MLRQTRFAFLAAAVLTFATLLPAQVPGTPPPLLGGLIAIDSQAGETLRALESAKQATELGFSGAAREIYETILARSESTPAMEERAVLGLSTIAISSGLPDEAETALKRTVALNTSPIVAVHRAMIALLRKDTTTAGNAIAAILPDALPREEQIWYFVCLGMIADSKREFERAQQAYTEASVRAAGSELAKARVLLSQERSRLLFGQASFEIARQLERQVEQFAGRRVGYDFARQLAVVLDMLGEKQRAISLLERQLQTVQLEEHESADQLRLLLALVAGPESSSGQTALRRILIESQQPIHQRIALQLLATAAKTERLQAAFVRELDSLIADPVPSRVLDDLYAFRARLALDQRNYTRAEEDCRKLLENFPGSSLRSAALSMQVTAAWEQRRYRAAAELIRSLRDELRTAPERGRFSVLLAEAFFRATDYRNAADAYAAAILEPHDEVSLATLVFQRVLSLLRAGQLDDATKVLDAYAQTPGFSTASYWQAEWNLTRALQASGQAANAYARTQRILSDPASSALPEDLRVRLEWLRARLALETGASNDAIRMADELVQRVGTTQTEALGLDLRKDVMGTARLLKAQAFLALGQTQQGLSELQKLRDDSPGSEAAINSFIIQASELARAGQTVEAQQLLIELADKNPTSVYAPYALFEAATNAQRRGLDAHYRDAYEILERLATGWPKDELFFYARLRQGDLLRKLNQFGPAQQVYEFLVIRFPEHRDVALADLALADTLFAQASTDSSQLGSALARYERLFDLPSAPADVRIEAGFKYGYGLGIRSGNSSARKALWLVLSRFLLDTNNRASLGAKSRYWLSRAALEYAQICERGKSLEEARNAYELILQYELPGGALARSRLASLSGKNS